MKLKTYTEFINEAHLSSIKAGEDSKVEVSDQKTIDGTIIPAQEILGQIIASSTEGEFKSYFYEKYGSTKFDVETMSQMEEDYQEYYKEQAEKEKEKKKEEEEGGEEDPLGDLDI
tara:strand:+ start:2090 stop:2434 length:345 start_codon:yes stop_codon:yes gene_type:complete